MPITIGRASWARTQGSKHEPEQRPVSSPVATEQAPERSGNPRTTRGGGEGRARLGRESSSAHARHHDRTRLNHQTPPSPRPRTLTGGRTASLTARSFHLRPPSAFQQHDATNTAKHTNTHTHTHSPPLRGSAPDFPTLPSLPVSPTWHRRPLPFPR